MKKILNIIIICLCCVLLFGLFANLPNKHTENNNQVDYSQLTYVAFGDSITRGHLPVTGTMKNPYPKLVADELGLLTYVNKGVGGAVFCKNSTGQKNMTEEILKYNQNADIISLLLGVNDYNTNNPLGTIDDKDNTTIYGSLNLIAEYLTLKYPNSFIFFMTPYKTKGCGDTIYNSSGYRLVDIANAVKSVASNYNIPVLDLFNNGQFELEMYNTESDGLHPTQEFVKTYTAPQIAQFIKDNYKK